MGVVPELKIQNLSILCCKFIWHRHFLPKMAMEEENELSEIISSYSEPSESEEQESISQHSEEEDISETSEDRAFVVSDGDQSPYSNRSSESSNYSQHCHHRHDDDFSNPVSCMGILFLMDELTSLGWPQNTDKHNCQTSYPPE